MNLFATDMIGDRDPHSGDDDQRIGPDGDAGSRSTGIATSPACFPERRSPIGWPR